MARKAPEELTPHSIEAEEAVLGSLLIDPAALFRVSAVVRTADFYVHKHAWLYEALLALHEQRRPADFLTVCDELERAGHLDDVGGTATVTRLMSVVPSAIHAEAYAHIVAHQAGRRRLLGAASEIGKLALDDKLGQGEAEVKARKALDLALDGAAQVEALKAYDAAAVLWADVGAWAESPLRPGEVRGLSTGLLDLDDLLKGLGPGLYLVGGVQHTGKTALCQQVARNVAAQGQPVLFLSLEHTREYMYHRIASAETGLSMQRIQAGLNSDDLVQYAAMLDALRAWPLEVIGQQLTLPQMEVEVRARARDGLALVVVDNLEQATRSVPQDKDYVRLRNAAYWMLAMGQESEVPVMTTMQIGTKMVVARSDKKPDIADLYGSDGPAQAASVVLLLHRKDRWTFDETEKTNVLEVTCWKDKVNFTGTGRGKTFQFWHQGQVRDMERSDDWNGRKDIDF